MGGPLQSRPWRRWLVSGVLVAGIALAVWLHRPWERRPKTTEPDSQPQAALAVPPLSATRFLNAGPEARYIGTSACAECHRSNHQSYLLTPHSRALSDLEPDAEPPGGSFFHAASGRNYRVYRQDGQFRHEEVLRTEDGREITRLDFPIRYLIGSGHFTRTYLIEVDGFLHESPITWYTSKRQWDTSPGYDVPRHWSFERAITADCLACHAGRAEPVGGTVHRMAIREKAIGCENCHGPGSLHAERHRAGRRPPGEEDLTIVHPGKLSRPLLESVCAVCHLGGAAMVDLRGRHGTEFRPGRPLTDYRVTYRFDAGGDEMTVVGHIEQLRRSACYQQSEDLTCLTCHDPHARQKPPDPVAFYRQKCLNCHDTRPCGLAPAERRKKDAADDCTACHMPRGDTELPHIAFTHHRIGRHGARPAPVAGGSRELAPADDVAHLGPADRQRNLGLAYLIVAGRPENARDADAFRERARSLLEAAFTAGLRDGVTAEALAEIYWHKDQVRLASGRWPASRGGLDRLLDRGRAAMYGRHALAAADLTAGDRARALLLMADCDMHEDNFASAAGRLQELTRMRRFAEDWRLLALCYLKQEQPDKALEALRHALAIRPTRPLVHDMLDYVYTRLGDGRRAAEHREKAEWLLQHHQE